MDAAFQMLLYTPGKEIQEEIRAIYILATRCPTPLQYCS